MGVGMKRPRNWGKDEQLCALLCAMDRREVAWKIRKGRLFLAGARDGITLPFNESVADLVHTRRGRWEARHPFDGRVIARGVSERDVVRATIIAVWQ